MLQFRKSLGISKSKVYKILASLEKKDIIYKGANSTDMQFFVNPYLFCKGARINKTLLRMFENYEIRTKIDK